MLPYWLLFFVPALGAVSERPRNLLPSRVAISWLLIWTFITIFIGVRYQVGADWYGYERIFWYSSSLTFAEASLQGDPGYYLLNWAVAKSGYDIALVNVLCGAIFTSGLLAFAREQPRPWLAITIAIPYLVVVVAMGYSRQSVAIGLAMLALCGLGANSATRFFFWITLATLFHKTALLLVPIAILAKTSSRMWTLIASGFVGFFLYDLFLSKSVDVFLTHYIESQYASQGAALRIMMNAIPAAIFLISRRRFKLEGAQLKLWTYISIGSLVFILLFFLSPSSTAVDRIALYFIPVQIFVFSRLPAAWRIGHGIDDIIKIGVILYSALVLFVWLQFAHHAEFWLPYKMVPFYK